MIKIKRDSGFVDSLRAYKIILDGRVAGKIGEGQQVTLDIPPGSHQLYLKIDWGRSNKVDFESNDRMINFECGSNLRGVKMLLAIVYTTFLRTKYLWLKKI